MSLSANHRKIISSHEKIAGKLTIFVPWTIRATNIVIFPGILCFKPYKSPISNFPQFFRQLAAEKIAKIVQDDHGKGGQPGKVCWSYITHIAQYKILWPGTKSSSW